MKISLTGGDAHNRSVLASCQRRLNMYSEASDPKQGEPGQVTHYPTPGLRLLGTSPNNIPLRGLYRASNGDLYAVAGLTVYWIDSTWSFHTIGTLKNITKTTTTVSVAPIAAHVRLTTDGTAAGTPVTVSPVTPNTTVGIAVLVADATDVVQTNVTGWTITGDNAASYVISATGVVSTGPTAITPGTENIVINATVPDVTKKVVTTTETDPPAGTVFNPIKMADNGTNVIICDGVLNNGYTFTISTRSGIKPLLDPSASDAETDSSTGWLGSTYVDFSDGYLIGNFIGTPTFFISNSEDVIFDPLQFGAKTSYPDALVAAVVIHRVIWLIGQVATEIWYNSGGGGIAGNNFPFELMPGVAIDWGCAAPYSIAKAENSLYWLAQNQNGEVVVLQGNGIAVKRISTHALEDTLRHYAAISDCMGYCYMQDGHSMYVMNFPTGDATWVCDLSSGDWHQRAWIDNNGEEHRHRASLHAYAYGLNVVNDWQNGNVYALDLEVYTDAGQPIKRVIGMPRQVDSQNGHRIVYREFTAEIDAGETLIATESPQIGLRWSDDKGRTYGNTIFQPLGKTGEFNHIARWYRMGIARTRNYELEWTANGKVALQGAYVDIIQASS